MTEDHLCCLRSRVFRSLKAVPFPRIRRDICDPHILATWPATATGPMAHSEPALSIGIAVVAVPATLPRYCKKAPDVCRGYHTGPLGLLLQSLLRVLVFQSTFDIF